MFQLIGRSIKECPSYNTLIQHFLNNAIQNEYITLDEVKSYAPDSISDKKPQDFSLSLYPESRQNAVLMKSGIKKSRQFNPSPQEDQILSPDDYSFKSDKDLAGSDQYGKLIIIDLQPSARVLSKIFLNTLRRKRLLYGTSLNEHNKMRYRSDVLYFKFIFICCDD